MKKQKVTIFSTIIDDIEEYRDGFEEWCEDNGLDPNKESIYDFGADSIRNWCEAEFMNLNVECGDILEIADLGLWDGRHSAYNIINKGKLNGILNSHGCDDFDIYCDRYNVKGTFHHHDGVNYIEYRLIKPNVDITPLTRRLYNQEEVTREMIRKYTTSLRPLIQRIYGFK